MASFDVDDRQADTAVADRPGSGAEPTGRRRGRHGSMVAADRRRQQVWGVLGALGVVAALVMIVVGTSHLGDGLSVPVRIAVVVVGAVLGYLALDRLGRVLFGPRFDTGLWLSVFWVAVVVLAAVFADLLPLSESRDVAKALETQALQTPDLLSAHPLGTDRQGLDILGGVIYGARVSLTVALGAIAIGTVVGGLIGIAAGWFAGKIDVGVRLLTDSMLAFPPLVLLLAMVSVLEPNVVNVTLALGLLGIPLYIRLARVNAMVFAPREFVLAARALGAKSSRIIFRELLPNVALPVLSYGFIVVGVLIVAEASLSFLGLSISRPNPTWGNMIASGQNDIDKHPHLVFAPGVVLFLTVFALNRIGDRARALWDHRQRKH